MGELGDNLAANLQDIRLHGGSFEHDCPLDLIRDILALRRAIPEATVLAADSPPLIGYTAFWDVDGIEVSVSTTMPISALRRWRQDPWKHSETDRRIVNQVFQSSEGRRSLVEAPLEVFSEAETPPPEPEPEVYRPTRWERLLDDDEPL